MGPSNYLNLELLQLRTRPACAAQGFLLSTSAVTVWQCHLGVNNGLNSCCLSNNDQLSSAAPKALCKNVHNRCRGRQVPQCVLMSHPHYLLSAMTELKGTSCIAAPRCESVSEARRSCKKRDLCVWIYTRYKTGLRFTERKTQPSVKM